MERKNAMNNEMTGVIGEAEKSKRMLKKRHFYLICSQVSIAAFVMFLAHYASREALLAGLCGLATVTMIVAFAAFFRAYETN
jgi:ABC-type enterochelin transport system permease subunit